MSRTDITIKKKPQKTHFVLVLCLLIIVMCSALGLDYITWQRGEKSFIFSHLLKPSSEEKREELDQLIMGNLSTLGIPLDPDRSYRDNLGVVHMSIPVEGEIYTHAAPLFLMELKRARIVVGIGQKSDDTSDSFIWELESDGGQKAVLLFTCPRESVNPPEDSPYKKPKNKVAIIVDDMGNSLQTVRDLGALGQPLTLAILPYSARAVETARTAQENNLEVILHLPLESLNDHELNSITEGLIHSGMSEEERRETLEEDLARIPNIRGVNNHMGSKITANREWMTPILTRLKEKGLYFIDSVTDGRSIAFRLAREMGVPSAYRHVFLDAETEEDYILKQFKQLLRLAQRQGMAVGICHPQAATLRVLTEHIHLLEKYDCEAVFASQIVK